MDREVNEMRVKMSRRGEKGQSLVELVLILPFLLLLLIATVEAGFALREYLIVQSVNREGVRWAVRTPPTQGDAADIVVFKEYIPQVFGRIEVAAEEAGLQPERMGVILTHIYTNSAGDEALHEEYHWGWVDTSDTRVNPQVLADDNLIKHNAIATLRANGKYEEIFNEIVVVEVFYLHETVWGFTHVGPLGADWVMYANSSMRMVGTGR